MICTKLQSPLNVKKQRTISIFVHLVEEDKTYTYNINENSNILKSLTNFIIFLMIQINLKIEYNFCLINVINEDDTEQLTSDAEFLKSIDESEELGFHLLLFGAYINDKEASVMTSSDLPMQNVEKLFHVNKAIAKASDTNMRLNPLFFANKSEQITFRNPISLKPKTQSALQDVGLQYEDQGVEIINLKSIEMKEEYDNENTANEVKTIQTDIQKAHLTIQSTTSGPNNLVIHLEEKDTNFNSNKKLQIQSTEYGTNNLHVHIDEKNSKDLDCGNRAIVDESNSSENVKSLKEGHKVIQNQKISPKVIEKRTNLVNHRFDQACECCDIDITNCDIDYEGNRPIKRRLSDDSIQLRSPDAPYLSYAKPSSNSKTHKQAKNGRRKFSGIRFQQRKRK